MTLSSIYLEITVLKLNQLETLIRNTMESCRLSAAYGGLLGLGSEKRRSMS